MVEISRAVSRARRELDRFGAEGEVVVWSIEEESQPGVERAAAGGEEADGRGGCAGGAPVGFAFLAWASQASRVAWSTGHFSAEGSEDDMVVRGLGLGLWRRAM